MNGIETRLRLSEPTGEIPLTEVAHYKGLLPEVTLNTDNEIIKILYCPKLVTAPEADMPEELTLTLWEVDNSELGIKITEQAFIRKTEAEVRLYNVGASDYARHKIQPWDIWLEYRLNPFDADIIKRVLRNKQGESRRLDYEKIIHVCQERIRQIDNNEDNYGQ